MPDLKDKVALITGAASGIGRESALAFCPGRGQAFFASIFSSTAPSTPHGTLQKLAEPLPPGGRMLPSQATVRRWSPQPNGSLVS